MERQGPDIGPVRTSLGAVLSSRVTRRGLFGGAAGAAGLYLTSQTIWSPSAESFPLVANLPVERRYTIFSDPIPLPPDPISHSQSLSGKEPLSLPETAVFPECNHAYVMGHPEIKINNTHVIGKFLCFPDQPEGKAAVEAGNYNNGLSKLLSSLNPFFNYYMGLNITYEIQAKPLVMQKNLWDYPDAGSLIVESIQRLSPIPYDGNTYRVYSLYYTPDLDVPYEELVTRFGGHGGNMVDFGMTILPWFIVKWPEYEAYIFTVEHEHGHTIGRPDNNEVPESYMNNSWDSNPHPRIVHPTDIVGICGEPPTPSPTQEPTPTSTSTPTKTPTPTPTPEISRRLFLPIIFNSIFNILLEPKDNYPKAS